MPASVIGKSLNLGYPGNVSRNDPRTFVMPRVVKSAAIPFGVPVQLNTDGTYDVFAYNSLVGVFAGIALRNVKQQILYASNVMGEYEIDQSADVLEQGFITVSVNPAASLTAGGAVFAVFAETSNVFLYFDIVAPGTGSGTGVALTNCHWVSNYHDGNNVAELEIGGLTI